MSEETKKPCVEYNWLSENCGLKVSNICLGTAQCGKPVEWYDVPGFLNKVEAFKMLDRFAELGGNFIDTANIYCNGESEEIIGSWLSSRDRGSIVVATKVFFRDEFGDDSKPNSGGLSRGSIMYNVEQSLRRLQTDYIDLYYMHWYDKGVKLEETLRTLDDLIRSGKVRYIGLSNFTGSKLQKVMDYNQFMGFTPCVALQQQYNLLSRGSDIEVVPTCRSEGISLLPYSPLAGGLLTGKFKRDDCNSSVTLAGTRMGWVSEKPAERKLTGLHDIEELRNNDDYWKLMNGVESIAKEHGKTAVQVSLRWLLQKDFISAVVIGPKTIKQLEDNMGAGTGWRLTDEQMKLLDELSNFVVSIPKYPYNTIDKFNNLLNRNR